MPANTCVHLGAACVDRGKGWPGSHAFIDQTTPDAGHTYSAAKDYLVGPAIELRFPFTLAVEFDALHRPLHLTESIFNVLNNSSQTSQGTINTWQFPWLVKYHLPSRGIRPFVEVGPSFRHTATSALFLSNPPQLNHGFTAGGGGEISIWKLRIAPEIRYTRWAADTYFPFPNSDQAELLVGRWTRPRLRGF